MIQIGVGMSSLPDTLEAVRQAFQQASASGQLPRVEWVLVFFTTEHIPHADQIRTTLLELTSCECISGCSGSGVLSNYGELTTKPGISLMLGYTPEHPVQAFVKRQESEHSVSLSRQLKLSLESFSAPDPLLLFFPDAYQHHPYNFINTLNYVKTSPKIFGGGSCDNGTFQVSAQLGPDTVVQDGLSGLCLGNMTDYQIGITQSCTPIGEPMFITKSEGNTILTLDGYPALDVFVTLADNMGLSDLESAGQYVLLSFPLDSQRPQFTGENSLIRHVSGVEVPTQGLAVPHIFEQGQTMSFVFRSMASAQQDLYEMLYRLEEKQLKTPSFGIYFNCTARGEALYGVPDFDTQAIAEVLGEFPLVGFFGNYEFASIPQGLQLYSYTGVLLLIYS
ncbi:MAG: FIST C-terminal domain-containing protein [SAR324 cluster bacterium]|nr:FIST C-terminal domain-containing protein [SAR324 cluster bacterium]